MARCTSLSTLALALLAGLSACGGGEYLKNVACEAPVTLLTPDLTTHVASGPGDGTFAYDPDGELVATVTGDYDLVSGDFTWTELAANGSWYQRAEVSGYGYANRNGNLDVIGDRLVIDSLDLERREQFRVRRIGCSMERRLRQWTTSGERESVELGTYAGTSYDYEIERIGGASTRFTEGSRDTALDFTETITEERPGYSFEGERTGNLGDGEWVLESEESISTRQGTVLQTTTRERARDGSQVVEMTQTFANGTRIVYSYELDYGGNGDGTLTGPGLSCSLTFTGGECRYACPNGDRGLCYAG